MIDWVKVWWHCLLKTFANLKGEDHRTFQWSQYYYSFTEKRFITDKSTFCTCGYSQSK